MLATYWKLEKDCHFFNALSLLILRPEVRFLRHYSTHSTNLTHVE